MRQRTTLITCMAVLLLLGQDALAQRRSGGRLSTFRSSRYRSTDGRAIDVLRQSPLYRPGATSLLEQPRQSWIRTRYILEGRNMLMARSVLGRNVTPFVGRSTILQGTLPKVSPILRPYELPDTKNQEKDSDTNVLESTSYEDALENRLDRMAKERFELGAAYARVGDYIQAKHAFEGAKQIRYDDPRPYVASMFVAYKQANTNTAILQMAKALDHTENLNDLRIENFVDLFNAGETHQEREQAFRVALERLNIACAVGGEASPLNAVLAYFSWIDGDLDAAIRAAEAAAQAPINPKYQESFEKFHDLLAAERQARQSPTKAEEQENLAPGESGNPKDS